MKVPGELLQKEITITL